jgi:hypothetical protein
VETEVGKGACDRDSVALLPLGPSLEQELSRAVLALDSLIPGPPERMIVVDCNSDQTSGEEFDNVVLLHGELADFAAEFTISSARPAR